jgi:cobalt-zinc-cadmium efflux system protein
LIARPAVGRERRLWAALGLNLAVVLGELVAGVLGHASALLADAGHNLIDVTALAAALATLRWAARPRSDQRSFGNHRATILAALFNAMVLAIVTVSIAVVAIERVVHPEQLNATVLTAVAAAALVANALAALLLAGPSSDLNMRAAFTHMAADAASAGVALAAGVVILLVGPAANRADPAAALAVSVLIVFQAIRLVRASVEVLLESTPADVDLGALRKAMTGVDGVGEVHDLHVWSLSSDVRALSAHLVLAGHPSLEEAQGVAEHVRAATSGRFGVAHATFELECERCSDSEDPCEVAGSAGDIGLVPARPGG